ncbi:hypothetical protein GCM10029992_53910 [Glycomyces albus]
MAKRTKVTNNIRALRFANGEMTQAQLADRIDVTRQTVIAIEQGRYSPRWRWPSRSPGSSKSRSTRSSDTTSP